MFDFRYHALSLVAVFLALGIGILLGSTIGDNLASQANKDLSSSLRGDLLAARKDARDASSNVSQRDRLILHLRFSEDLTQSEIADRIGIMKEGRKVMERTRRELEQEDLQTLYLDYMRGGVIKMQN